MIGIKSMTSGRLLPCTRIKQSRLRLLCGMPDVLVEVQRDQFGLSGPALCDQWVRESDILTLPAGDEPVTVEGWESLLLGVCYSGIKHKLERGQELTEAQQRLFDEVMVNTGAKHD